MLVSGDTCSYSFASGMACDVSITAKRDGCPAPPVMYLGNRHIGFSCAEEPRTDVSKALAGHSGRKPYQSSVDAIQDGEDENPTVLLTLTPSRISGSV